MPRGQSATVNSANRGRRLTGILSRRATRVFTRPRKEPPFALTRGAALGRILGVIMCRPEVSLATGSDASTPLLRILAGSEPARSDRGQ